MSNEEPAPETKGVTVELLATVDLKLRSLPALPARLPRLQVPLLAAAPRRTHPSHLVEPRQGPFRKPVVRGLAGSRWTTTSVI